MADPIFIDGVTPLNAVNMTKLQTRDEKAVANGYASLASDGKVPLAQLPPFPQSNLPANLGAIAQQTTDWNAAQANGWYWSAYSPQAANAPTNGSVYVGEVIASEPDVPPTQPYTIYQRVRTTRDGIDASYTGYEYERNYIGGTWGAWSKLQYIPQPLVTGQFVKGGTGVPVWAALAAADMPKNLGIAYGTTLPASPVDGQRAILVDSTTNPSYQWEFRYNAGSSSAYKWEFVGGISVQANLGQDETTTTALAWLDLATIGPSFIVPRAGEYAVSGGARISHSAGSQMYFGISLGAAAPNLSAVFTTGTNVAYDLTMTQQRLVGIAASTELRMRYYMAVAGTGHWAIRYLTVTPVRVS